MPMRATKHLFGITLLAALTSITGCGTLLNLGEKDSPPYGGVILDSEIVAQGVPLGLAAWSHDIDVPSFWPLALIDLPFSLAGDTVTLPITVTTFIQKQRESPLQRDPPTQAPALPSLP
jgi:uncharacterized protein YceK